MKRAYALFNLAWRFWYHVFKLVLFALLPFLKKDPYEQFVVNFKEDNLKPNAPETTSTLIEAHRCTACGLCRASGGRPYLLPIRESRDLSMVPDKSFALKHDLDKAEALCPYGVPLKKINSIL